MPFVKKSLPSAFRYFSEDVPVLLFTSLPLVLLGVWLAGDWWSRGPFLLALWELVYHSCLSHKEHRYVFPIVPVGSVYAGVSSRKLEVEFGGHGCHYLYTGYAIWWTFCNYKTRGEALK